MWLLCATTGLTGVALGAFGAHGMAERLAGAADGARRLEIWHTASEYHLVHALALGLVAVLASRVRGRAAQVAGVAFTLGVLLFSGSLYVLSWTGARALGAVTPIGGMLFMIGWGAMAVAAWRAAR